jgi:hypothetical protein
MILPSELFDSRFYARPGVARDHTHAERIEAEKLNPAIEKTEPAENIRKAGLAKKRHYYTLHLSWREYLLDSFLRRAIRSVFRV